MSAPVMTDQFFDHGWKRSQNTDTPNQSVGRPKKPNQSLGVDILEW